MGLFMKACRLDLDGGGILDIGRGFLLDGFDKTGIGRLGIGHTGSRVRPLGYPLVYYFWLSEFGSPDDSLHVLLWIENGGHTTSGVHVCITVDEKIELHFTQQDE
jgi:hypothetical protein